MYNGAKLEGEIINLTQITNSFCYTVREYYVIKISNHSSFIHDWSHVVGSEIPSIFYSYATAYIKALIGN